jgi:hypothetical protein
MGWRLIILPKRVEKDRGVEASERVIGRMGLVTFGERRLKNYTTTHPAQRHPLPIGFYLFLLF